MDTSATAPEALRRTARPLVQKTASLYKLGPHRRGAPFVGRAASRGDIDIYSLIVTAKMNYVDLQAWLADVLARIAEHPAHRIDAKTPFRSRKTNGQSREVFGIATIQREAQALARQLAHPFRDDDCGEDVAEQIRDGTNLRHKALHP